MTDQIASESLSSPSVATLPELAMGALFELPDDPTKYVALGYIAAHFHASGSQMYADFERHDNGEIAIGIMAPLPDSTQPTVTGHVPRADIMDALRRQYAGDFGINLLQWAGGDDSANPWRTPNSTQG